ncbi:MAG: Arm DNA-binding domain-containing protein [Alphaproteobacteria bacterium]|nr:Arm DNA-binding domain-containing protein [Alphaproteobacteria bacterium]
MRLTDASIARLRPREREYTVWDTRVAGLGVRVRPSGGRSYVLLLDAGGRTKRVSLGQVGVKSLEEVRRECHAHRARTFRC